MKKGGVLAVSTKNIFKNKTNNNPDYGLEQITCVSGFQVSDEDRGLERL